MAAVRPNDDLVARVVAWHNRNPLARRISPAQVVSVGLVSFPYWVPGAAAPGASAAPAQAGGASAPPAADPSSQAQAGAASPGAAAGSESQAPGAEGSTPASDASEPAGAGGPGQNGLHDRLRDRARHRALARAATAGPVLPTGRGTLHAPPGPGRKSWRAAFDENLLDPHKPSEVARWALRHGSSQRPGPSDAPVRDLEPRSGGPRGAELARVWVYTAAIDLGAQRVRVIVSPLDTRRVLGPRIVAFRRMGTWAGMLAAGMAAGAAVWLPDLGAGRVPVEPGPMAAAKPPPAPAAAVAAASSSPGPAEVTAALPADGPSPPGARPAEHAGAAPPPAQAAAPAPAAVQGHRSGPFIRSLAPALSDEARLAAREASEAARNELAARAHRAAPPSPSPSPLPAAARAAAAAAPAPAPVAAWAVSTRNLRTRFESEQMLAALRDAAYRGGHGSELTLEVLPSGDDWRAVGWPFATRADAERLRAALAARGLKAEVVQF